jgi:hypothetical protein
MTLLIANGCVRALWTDAIPLRNLGPCTVERASTVDFNPTSQEWEVRVRADRPPLFCHPDRSRCLQWETDHDHLLLTPA